MTTQLSSVLLAIEQVSQLSDHQIPAVLFKDNITACEMNTRLVAIHNIVKLLYIDLVSSNS